MHMVANWCAWGSPLQVLLLAMINFVPRDEAASGKKIAKGCVADYWYCSPKLGMSLVWYQCVIAPINKSIFFCVCVCVCKHRPHLTQSILI